MSLKLTKKIQILVTEETWMDLNRDLNKRINSGDINSRISFSAYLRSILEDSLKK